VTLPGKYDLYLYEATDETRTITIKDSSGTALNLSSGYTAKLQVREKVADTTAKVSLTESSGITLGNGTGNVVITFTDTQVNTLGAKFKGVYSLVITQTSGSISTAWLAGDVYVTPNPTR
jgi:hypothetical protein